MAKMITQEEWDEWYAKVYGYFYRRIDQKSEVEDLTANTLYDFFLKDEEIENPNGLMWTIAKRKLLDYIKLKKPQNLELTEEMTFQQEEKIYSIYYQERRQKLLDCAKEQLPQLDWEIVELCVMEDFSSQEVSEKMGISSDNVRQKLSRGLKKLREKCQQVWLKFA